MERMLKWITLSAAAAALAFGGATLAGDLLERNDPANSALAADQPSATEPLQDTTQAAEQTIATPAPAKDEPFVIKRILPIDGPIKYGEWHWDEDGVPAGPLVMTVDLEARVLSVFRNGYEIGATAVLLGTQDHPTPLGSFPILQKKRDNVSSIYGAAMPYTLRLTWDGISIHGSPVENGFASHGCIGTPNEFAAKLFAVASKGDTVIITRGKMIGMGDSII